MPRTGDNRATTPGIVVMGVCGCGKSTVAGLLAEHLSAEYLDADSLHPAENIAKMSRGEPLTDDDRWPWLESVGQILRTDRMIVACSALRRAYRDQIRRSANRPICFLYLRGDRKTIRSRMSGRNGHYMPVSLLNSQIAILEEPQPDELSLSVDIRESPKRIVGAFVRWLDAAG